MNDLVLEVDDPRVAEEATRVETGRAAECEPEGPGGAAADMVVKE